MFKFSKPRWELVKDTKVCETPIFSLHQRDLIPDKEDEAAPFYILKAPEWINVIALTHQNEIVLVEQYRAGIDRPTLEIPGGMVDEGETPFEAAKRELAEETGFRSEKWVQIGNASSNPAILSNFTHLWLAKECVQTEDLQPDEHEDIAIHRMPLGEFFGLIRNGTIHHAIVLAAVAQFLLQDL